MKIEDFKVVIRATKVPVNVNNEVVKYVREKSYPNTHLHCQVFYKDTLIAKGVVLSFYKEFEILRDFDNNLFTHILTFDYYGKTYFKNTPIGQKIYEMKYFTNPPIIKERRKKLIDDILFYFNGYIKSLKEKHKNLAITFIPSNSKIPNELALKLSHIKSIPLKDIISKKSLYASKNISDISLQRLNKYEIDFSKLNINDTFILIDDIMGTTASICEIMFKLYDFNKKINYFLIPVKDVKR